MQVVAELDVLDAAALEDVDAERAGAGGELVLEPAPVDLVVVVRREAIAGRTRRACVMSLLPPAGKKKRRPHLISWSFSRWSFIPTTSAK